jgi:hypothetical protein
MKLKVRPYIAERLGRKKKDFRIRYMDEQGDLSYGRANTRFL